MEKDTKILIATGVGLLAFSVGAYAYIRHLNKMNGYQGSSIPSSGFEYKATKSELVGDASSQIATRRSVDMGNITASY